MSWWNEIKPYLNLAEKFENIQKQFVSLGEVTGEIKSDMKDLGRKVYNNSIEINKLKSEIQNCKENSQLRIENTILKILQSRGGNKPPELLE